MDAPSIMLITKALDGLSMRYLATAENIANAGSTQYQSKRVDFEDSLRAAADQGTAAVARFRPVAEASGTGSPGGEIRLDLEVATASETAMRYAALVDILGRQMEINRLVARGGQ